MALNQRKDTLSTRSQRWSNSTTSTYRYRKVIKEISCANKWRQVRVYRPLFPWSDSCYCDQKYIFGVEKAIVHHLIVRWKSFLPAWWNLHQPSGPRGIQNPFRFVKYELFIGPYGELCNTDIIKHCISISRSYKIWANRPPIWTEAIL